MRIIQVFHLFCCLQDGLRPGGVKKSGCPDCKNFSERAGACDTTESIRFLDSFESAAHRRVVDIQVRGDLVEPISMRVRLGDRLFATLCKYPLQRGRGRSQLRARYLLNVLFTRSVFLDERFTSQVDLTLEIVSRPTRHSVPDELPISLLCS